MAVTVRYRAASVRSLARHTAGRACVAFALGFGALACVPALADGDVLKFESPVQNGVVLTARSLLLNQRVSITRLENVLYATQPWNYGSLSDALALTPADLQAMDGKRVLDVGGGASILGDELVTVFGAERVDVVDLNQDEYNRRMSAAWAQDASLTNRNAVGVIYQQNMERLGYILRDVVNDDGWIDVHRRLEERAAATAESYFTSPKIVRRTGDATDLPSDLGTSVYDLVVSSWVLMYLDEEQRKNAIEEAIRVARPGAQIRLRGGVETADGGVATGWPPQPDGTVDAVNAARFRAWYGDFREIHGHQEVFEFMDLGGSGKGKSVRINPASSGNLLVLDVI
ncbi:hypothetical protein CCR96_04715 [Halochromatium roseum]|nr:hypothetical protein [Halochromatium roseum]